MQPGFSLPMRFLKDFIIPLGWSVLMVGVFCGLCFLFSNMAVDGIMAFSQSGQARLNRVSSAAAETLVIELRETVQRRFYLAALVALVAALLWYLSLLLRPMWRAGEARGRRLLWWGLLSLVTFLVALSFLLTLIPAIALALNDTLASDASSGVFFGVTAFGTAGAGLAYWLATLIGTPGYARPAVLFGSLLVGSAGTKKGGE